MDSGNRRNIVARAGSARVAFITVLRFAPPMDISSKTVACAGLHASGTAVMDWMGVEIAVQDRVASPNATPVDTLTLIGSS